MKNNTNTPLLTDFYQLTMAYGYWQQNMAEREAVFQIFYRKNPFQGHYAIACGLQHIIDFLSNYHFSNDDLTYLKNLKTPEGNSLFSKNFLNYLKKLKFTCQLDAVAEGQVVFPHEPLLRVQGPLLQCQLIETPLVNFMNYASLIATKATRIYQAAQGDPVIEFGLRRTHGPNGAMMATRAAFIGGCEATSNTAAAKKYHIPVKGTLAHSWIMSFDNEKIAFEKFAASLPHSTILLVDTYNSIQGIKNAVAVGKKLHKQNRDLIGIRLDSGDLNKLSKQARKLLDAAGFTHTKIMASGDLDEYKITELKKQQAPIDSWGVGTRLMTAYDQPSLDVAYKLSAIRDTNGKWQYKIKISDTKAKTTHPGISQIRRYYNKKNQMLRDVVYDIELGLKDAPPLANHWKDLLIPIFKNGILIYKSPSISDSQTYCKEQLENFMTTRNHKKYLVKFDSKLISIEKQLIKKLKVAS